MDFESLDRYLLGEPVSKAALVSELLAERSGRAAAAPFYRALEAIGPRAADEALVALRLVLAGHEPSDERVRRLRALSSLARAAAAGDARGIAQALSRNRRQLGPLAESGSDPGALRAAVASAYRAELG
ncbi:MAG: hypothetical protein ACREM2_06530 [Vulcanimicrobiaceae bacterium]